MNPPFGTDQDSDGVADSCEEVVALTFQPKLRLQTADRCLTREPYWSVARDTDSWTTYSLKIFYLLSYHRDCGNAYAHKGDSEFIIVRVNAGYSGYPTRWYAQSVTTSAHYNTGWMSDDTRTTNYGDWPQWSGGYRIRPIVWVALDKHANYRNKAECDSGGFMDYDTCTLSYFDQDIPALSAAEANIGSKWSPGGGVPLKHTLYSRTSQPGVENFWNEPLWAPSRSEFCGWQTYVMLGECAGGYRTTLQNFGF